MIYTINTVLLFKRDVNGSFMDFHVISKKEKTRRMEQRKALKINLTHKPSYACHRGVHIPAFQPFARKSFFPIPYASNA